MVSSLDRCISTTILSSRVLLAIRFIQSLSTAFLNSDISQVSVATFVRYGGIFNVDFIANLLMSLSVKEF